MSAELMEPTEYLTSYLRASTLPENTKYIVYPKGVLIAASHDTDEVCVCVRGTEKSKNTC